MNDAQYTALMAEIIRGNNLLTRIVNAVEGVAKLGLPAARESAPAVGDTIVTTVGDGDYFRMGARGTIIEVGSNLYRVDFRYNENDSEDYKDEGGAFGGRWYVDKEACVLVKRGGQCST